jgi:hypothetical protein
LPHPKVEFITIWLKCLAAVIGADSKDIILSGDSVHGQEYRRPICGRLCRDAPLAQNA